MVKSKLVKKNEKFYRRKKRINRVIFKQVKKNKRSIIFGNTALNIHFPPFLDRPTDDVDILTPKPRVRARELEGRLDRNFRGDFFFVKKARHEGTYKVVSRTTRSGVADFSKPNRRIGTVQKRGMRVISIEEAKKMRRIAINNPEAEFRRKKDQEALKRIAVFEQLKKKRRMKPRPLSIVKLSKRFR